MLPQTKVFVGGLPQGSKPEDLRKVFEKFGSVAECDIMNRCGFVHMQTEEQAAAAIRALHNSSFNGGVISVERGRMKERGQRGGRGGGRGMMRGDMDRRSAGPMRGGHMGGRDAPYSRPMGMRGGDMRGPPMNGGGMGMRNGMGHGSYDRGMDRQMGGYADDRYGGYGGEDRRGFALMDGRGARQDPYASTAPMYDDRRGYGAPAPISEVDPMYGDDRRGGGMYYDDREIMERRAPMRAPMAMSAGYDRAPPRSSGMGDMYSRRSPMGGSMGSAGYDRDPYAQQYAPMPRGGGGGARGARDHGMGARRY